MRRFIFAVMMLCSNVTVWGQTDPIDQAIQVIRDFLGDPTITPRFLHKDYGAGLAGPNNCFIFSAPGYESIHVDIDKMRIVYWSRDDNEWVMAARTDLPMKSEQEIITIARQYAQQQVPQLFREFPNLELEIKQRKALAVRFVDGEAQILKEAIQYIVGYQPYFLNSSGKKIIYAPAGCSVSVEPYEGRIVHFGYRYMPMTLTDLTPNFSEAEAKTRIEQAFLNLGATKAVAVMSSPDEPYNKWVDGLIIGATQTSGLRLAYLFDYVITIGAPGHEEEFGTEEDPVTWRAAIDAHTGELFFFESFFAGGVEEKEKKMLLHGSRGKHGQFLREQKMAVGIGIGVLVMGCLLLLWTKRRRRRSAILSQ